MSRRLHLIYISFLEPILFRQERREGSERRQERETDKKKKACASMPRCLGLFLSGKCSDGGRREGDNESRAPFQDSHIVLIVQTGERREKEIESVFSEPVLKKEQTWLFPCNVLAQLCTNPVIMHIFWKHVKAAWRRDWAAWTARAAPPTAAHCLIFQGVLAKNCRV